ncbi:carbohydrate porin [Pseudomonas qingdaonensis]|nr:carbohydrate porin [Pseudomonas qingdaonensis]
MTERHGNNISNDRINDPRVGGFTSAQEVWGRGQTWRLTQMWFKQTYLDGDLDVKVGRFGQGEDFNSFPATSRTWPSAARRWATGPAASGTTGR